MKRKFIETAFPVKAVSSISAKEKNASSGHIQTLHTWWAGRPLAASRSTIFASLISSTDDKNEIDKKNEFIAKLAFWKNNVESSFVKYARKEILKNYDGKSPKILDLFGGRGSIPLEALRLGCETHSSDINPVAITIQKCILEYPQKYGSRNTNELKDENNKLASDVKKWSDFVLEKAKREIGKFYLHKNKIPVMGYITVKMIKCHNLDCQYEIPLMNYYWLSKKENRKIAAYPILKNKKVTFKIVGNGYTEFPNGFNPNKGTTLKARAVCIACGSTTDSKQLKKLSCDNKVYEKRIVVIGTRKTTKERIYLPVTPHDNTKYKAAEKFLVKKRNQLLKEYIFDPVPDEIIAMPGNTEAKPGSAYWAPTNGATLYGSTKWKDLFNERQLLSLIVFTEKIKQAYNKMIKTGYDKEYAKVVTTYLAIMLDKLADKNANLVRYDSSTENIRQVFGRQSLVKIWCYAELNPFSIAGWSNIQDRTNKVILHCSKLDRDKSFVRQESAMSLSMQDEYFDAVFTDPPYYDNVTYSLLSDFFYVWLKRTIGDLYPDLFLTPLTPKSEEILANQPLIRGIDKNTAKVTIKNIHDKDDFELRLSKSFKQIKRVLKNDGIAIIVYAHRSTDGWITLINSILESGLVITGTWPINTELKERMLAKDTAALNSSIYIIARKINKKKIGFYRDIRVNLRDHINKKLEYLWRQGISGGDFFISAIGVSMEVFGKYDKIVDDADRQITVKQILEEIEKIVMDFASNKVLGDTFGKVSKLTRFYVMWRMSHKSSKLIFDDARKLASSSGINLENEFGKGLVVKDKESVRMLGHLDRNLDKIDTSSMIDVLHKSMVLWKVNSYDELYKLLSESGFGKSDTFYRVAQAISELNPNTEESKLLDGLLSSKKIIVENMKYGKDIAIGQTKLEEH